MTITRTLATVFVLLAAPSVTARIVLMEDGNSIVARDLDTVVNLEMCPDLVADELRECLAQEPGSRGETCWTSARQRHSACIDQVQSWLANQQRLAAQLSAELLRQEAIKAPQASGRRFRDEPSSPILVSVESGRFVMGHEGRSETSPPHEVQIPYPFAISTGEITEAEWALCADAGACAKAPLLDELGRPRKELRHDRAITGVSWEEAGQYVAWLTVTTGKTYRLPTEAEWEYAARAGTTSRFWWGDEITDQNANCMNFLRPGLDGFNVVSPAETKRYAANAWGLFDTAGNVEEWVQDCPRQSEYLGYIDPPTDGTANTQCTDDRRMARGGSAWLPGYCSSAYRRAYPADTRSPVVGFRVVREARQ